MTQKLPTLPHLLLLECGVAILLPIRAQGPPSAQSFPCLVCAGLCGRLRVGVVMSAKRTPKSLSSGGMQSMFVMGRGEQ